MIRARRSLPLFAACWSLLGAPTIGCGSTDDPNYYQTGGFAGEEQTGGRTSGGRHSGDGGAKASGGAATGGTEAHSGGSDDGSDDESDGVGGQGEGSGGDAAGGNGNGSGGDGAGGATTCDGECRFAWPLKGEISRDWTIVNYVDLDPGPGILDFHGGDRSYDGHMGVDIAIASFRTMDQGISAYAVAPGIVTAVHDGEFDRNTIADINGCTAVANTVYVLHDDGREVRYLHFRKNSIVVEVGQELAVGEELGKVGSSGCSQSPHLHIELFDGNSSALVDPFKENLWLDPPDYEAPPNVMEVILSSAQFSSVDDVQNAPLSPSILASGYSFGISVISGGTRAGAVEQITFYRNDAYGFALSPFTFDGTESHYMRWWSVSVDEGDWRAEVSLDGDVVDEVEFVAE